MTESEAVQAARQLIETEDIRVGPFLGAHLLPDDEEGGLWIVGFHKFKENENATIECVESVTTVTIHVEDKTGEARLFYAM